MDAVLTTATSYVTAALAPVNAAFSTTWGSFVALLATLPFADEASAWWTRYMGDTTAYIFIVDVLPIMYVTVLPLLCVLCTMCGMCKPDGRDKRTGNRILRRVHLGISAIKRLNYSALSPGKKLSPTGKKFAGVASLSSAEKGKAGKATPKKATAPAPRGGDRRY